MKTKTVGYNRINMCCCSCQTVCMNTVYFSYAFMYLTYKNIFVGSCHRHMAAVFYFRSYIGYKSRLPKEIRKTGNNHYSGKRYLL